MKLFIKEVMQLLEIYSKIHCIQWIDLDYSGGFKNVRLHFKEETDTVLMYYVLSKNNDVVGKIRAYKGFIPVISRIDEEWASISLCNSNYNIQIAFEYIPTRIIENIAGRIW